MTSSEIIDQLLEMNDKEAISDLKLLFQTADVVKFAKHNPQMNENDANLINAIDFINETKQPEGVKHDEIELIKQKLKRRRLELEAVASQYYRLLQRTPVAQPVQTATPVVAETAEAEVRVGNCLPLSEIPVGTQIHNIELYPGKGGQMVRSAGNSAQLMAKEGKYATLRLPSGEMRMVPIICRASIGVVGNGDHSLINVGKAGRKRHMGIRPTVRGSVMNPNDHPHGGGEGKTGIGRPGPCTPWGKPALGLKTRKKNKASNKMIVRRRDGKAIK